MYWIKFECYTTPDEDNLRMMTERKLSDAGIQPPDRPIRTGWCLKDEFHSWFVEHSIPYVIRYAMMGHDSWWRLGITNLDDAIQVQLVWGKE